MKTLLHLLVIALFAVCFASCVKTIEVPQPVADPLTGSWVLNGAAENYGNGWSSFNAGISGVFTFYANGGAQYDDSYSLLQGNWYRYTQSGGYYDEYGNYYTDVHDAFQVQVSNSTGGSLDLYFDDITFNGSNEFIATYYNGKGIEKYIFDRY